MDGFSGLDPMLSQYTRWYPRHVNCAVVVCLPAARLLCTTWLLMKTKCSVSTGQRVG